MSEEATGSEYMKNLDELIELAAQGLEPSPFGDGSFLVEGAPASLQSPRKLKDDFIARVREATKHLDYYLTGDVTLDVYWFLHRDIRYRTDKSPDVDNILKPLIDALCGPDGLLVDDCQLSRVNVEWVSWIHPDKQQVKLDLRFIDSDFHKRQGLFFVDFGNGLCYPFSGHIPHAGLVKLLEAIRFMQEQAQLIRPYSEEAAYLLSSVQRTFHRSRIARFPVLTFEEAIAGRV